MFISVPDGQKVTMNVSYYGTDDEKKTIREELVLKKPRIEIESYNNRVSFFENILTLNLVVKDIYWHPETKEVTIGFKAEDE